MAVVVINVPERSATSRSRRSALLIVVGVATIRPAQIINAIRSGPTRRAVVVATFVLTMIIPVQFAVMAGVALARAALRRRAVQPHRCDASK